MMIDYYLDPPQCEQEEVTIDQITQVIEGIKSNPNSRRHIVSAWNVADLPDESMSPQDNVMEGRMALAPCHFQFQFYVAAGKLSCMFNMRSSDSFLGLPFNIASYALLTHMVARECELEVGNLIYTGGDVHIYNNHFEQVDEMLSREPKTLPKLWLNPKVKRVLDFTMDDIKLEGYEHHPSIKAPVAV
jgi:thymidylate synthase